MKLYSVHYYDEFGHYQEWAGSKREVSAAKKRIKNVENADIGEIFEHEVPTNKKGLIDWLNNFCNNGESAI